MAAIAAACSVSPAWSQTNPGAPAWIKPGMRITFYAASATTDAAGETLVPDDNAMEHEKQKAQKKADETGETQYYTYWKDDRGQQYSVSSGAGMSGQGYVELNVAAIDASTAALETRLYGIDVGTGTVRAPSPMGQVAASHTGGDYWIHPALLRQMIGASTKGVSAQQTTCELHGKTYQALRIRVRTDSGFTQRIYDLASGVLLRMSSASSRGGNAWVPDAGGTSHLGGGGTTLTEAWLVGTRQLKLPWIGMPPPDWVRQTHALRYAGTQGAFVPGSGPLGMPIDVRLSFRRTGSGWLEFTESDQVTAPYGLPPQQSQANRVVGTNQIGSLWIPPAALRGLKAGQQLDSDSVTHVRVTVEGSDGARVRVLEAGMEYRTEYVYDAKNGMLVGASQQQQVGPSTAQLTVELRGVD